MTSSPPRSGSPEEAADPGLDGDLLEGPGRPVRLGRIGHVHPPRLDHRHLRVGPRGRRRAAARASGGDQPRQATPHRARRLAPSSARDSAPDRLHVRSPAKSPGRRLGIEGVARPDGLWSSDPASGKGDAGCLTGYSRMSDRQTNDRSARGELVDDAGGMKSGRGGDRLAARFVDMRDRPTRIGLRRERATPSPRTVSAPGRDLDRAHPMPGQADRSPILAVNGGSSSLKFALFDPATRPRGSHPAGSSGSAGPTPGWSSSEAEGGRTDDRPVDAPDHAAAAGLADRTGSAGVAAVAAVGHRVVHGGGPSTEPERVTPGDARRVAPDQPVRPGPPAGRDRADRGVRPARPRACRRSPASTPPSTTTCPASPGSCRSPGGTRPPGSVATGSTGSPINT